MEAVRCDRDRTRVQDGGDGRPLLRSLSRSSRVQIWFPATGTQIPLRVPVSRNQAEVFPSTQLSQALVGDIARHDDSGSQSMC